MAKIKKMCKRDMNKYKALLIKQRNDLISIVSKNREGEEELLNHNVGDNIDLAADSSERELLFTLNDNERRRLDHINIALEKIEKGTYGNCEDCGKPISKGRLLVVPYTKFCIKCSAKNESF